MRRKVIPDSILDELQRTVEESRERQARMWPPPPDTSYEQLWSGAEAMASTVFNQRELVARLLQAIRILQIGRDDPEETPPNPMDVH